jgi:pimeloyl-ACP methyl ester carboxylesterase/lysophospholipase L1-like esterase
MKLFRPLLTTSLLLAHAAMAAEPRVAILGDSITYGGAWCVQVESALRATAEFDDAEIVNFGLSSETVSGLSEEGHAGGKFPRPCLHERLQRILTAFKPTHVLACYGMNDGIYLPPDPVRLKAYQDGISKLKSAVEQSGGQLVLITPPLHNADKPTDDPQRYDAALDQYAAWLVSQRAAGWQVIDIRPPLRQAIAAEKAKQPGFIFAGDGVHPGELGHGFIAKAVCAGLWEDWKLLGQPEIVSGPALGILGSRHHLLKHAWLSLTKHTRPGVPAGLPLDQANEQAAKLLVEYRDALKPKLSEWHGYQRIDFVVAGRQALLVRPKSPARFKPWIWRTEFFGHEPQGDLALLEKGFHVGYIDVQNLYGAPVALDLMDQYYDYLTTRFGLSKRPVLEGFSRGGLFAFNWAARHPSNVAGLYVDAPVCDFKSWPGGKGSGPGSAADWKRLLAVYQFTEDQALAYNRNPVDHLAPLALARIPILAVIGEADEVVPVSENIDLVEKRYLEMGGKIQVIRKPGVKHHPHSLVDPKPIVDFVLKTVP